MYKLSLIIPIYNTSKTFENTFQSIKNQSIGFENIELIYVDDCSTDNSKELIEDKAKHYNNIKYYSTSKNSGFPSKPRNIGISNSSSEYIMFLDQDDIFFEDACEILYNLISTENADIVSGNYVKTINSESSLLNWNMVNISENEIIRIDSIDKNKELLRLNPAIWTKIYKKSFLIENNIYFVEEILIEDVIFVSQCLLESNKIIFINIPIVNYLIRTHEGKSEDEGSLSIAKNKKVLYALMKGIKIFNKILKNYPEAYHWLAVRHLNFWMIQFIDSNLSREEKLEILIYSHELFEEFDAFERAQPVPENEFIFRKVINKQFDDAIKISEYINFMNNPFSNNNLIKQNEILFITKDFGKCSFSESLQELGAKFNIAILNIDSFHPKNIQYYFSKDCTDIENNFKIYDLYKYFFNKIEFKSISNNKYSTKENDKNNDSFIKFEEKYDDYNIIQYYKENNAFTNSQSSIDENYLIKQQYLIDNKVVYEIQFENKNVIFERFFNKTENNFLSIFHSKNDIYEFCNSINQTKFKFYSYDDFVKYFLLEIFQKYSEYFIVNLEPEFIPLIEEVRPKHVITLHFIENDFSFTDTNFIERFTNEENMYLISSNMDFLKDISLKNEFIKTIEIENDIGENQLSSHLIKLISKIYFEKKMNNLNNDKDHDCVEFDNASNLKQYSKEELFNIIQMQNNDIIKLKEKLLSVMHNGK